MSSCFLTCVLGGMLFGGTQASQTAEGTPPPYGYLWFYDSDGQGGTRKRVEPYQPREGDILFYDSMDWLWARFYNIAGTGPPLHAGIMVKDSAGTFSVLESGPDNKIKVYLLEATKRVHTFQGILQIRRCKKCLNADESSTLTHFAEAQVGKGLAVVRLVMQITPLKIRGGFGFREQLFGTTYMDRHRWLCIELVVTAGTLLGLFDPGIKGNVCYPLDLLYDGPKYDISRSHEKAGYWCAHP